MSAPPDANLRSPSSIKIKTGGRRKSRLSQVAV
jgi:hypothetical protein